MTTSQYKNVIDHTVKMLSEDEKESAVTVVNKILNSGGIALLDAEISQIKSVLSEGDYLGWQECSASEAQLSANEGTAVIGISDNKIVIVEPEVTSVEKSENENVVTVSDLSAEELYEMTFYNGGRATTGVPAAVLPDRIAQNNTDPDWDASLWGSYAGDAPAYGCSVACVAMAISNIDVDTTPLDIINKNLAINSSRPFYANWYNYGYSLNRGYTLATLRTYIRNYRYDPDTYAPPIVRVTNSDGNSHYILIFELDAATDIAYSVDPGYYGYDYNNDRILTNHWRVSNFGGSDGSYQIIQYHK